MSDAHLTRWQNITLATLFTGYAGYYICRTNLSVAAPLIDQEFHASGVTKEDIGRIASIGVLFYAIGKVSNGLLAEYFGGRALFLIGMFASVICTCCFGLSTGLIAFTVFWALNRYVQSMGWVSLVKISSRWYPVRRHATMLGILSMSYLIGDAFARAYLGAFMWADVGWRGVFFISAATLGAIASVTCLTLKPSPDAVGAEEPSANPANVFGEQGNLARPDKILDLLAPLMKSMSFWLICTVNFGLTLIRETFNLWTPMYLYESTGIDADEAAIKSLLFPLVGAVSALLAGVLSDRIGGKHGRIVVPSIFFLIISLWILGNSDVTGRSWLAVGLVSAVSFFLLAPYSYLSGVMALDLGGKRGSSTAAGLIDSAGYMGAILSGQGIGRIAEEAGWEAAFQFLAVVAAVTGVAAVAYWLHHELVHRRNAEPTDQQR